MTDASQPRPDSMIHRVEKYFQFDRTFRHCLSIVKVNKIRQRDIQKRKDSSLIDQSQNLINFVFIIEIRKQNQYNLGAGNW